MIHAHQLLSPQQTQHPGCDRHALEWGAHAWTLGVADAVHILDGDLGFLESLLDEPHDPAAVVFGGVFGEEAFAGSGDEGVPDVGEDERGTGWGGVGD